MGELKSDFTLIRDKDFPNHPARKAFVAEMEWKSYGQEALNDAWAWFKWGWERAATYYGY